MKDKRVTYRQSNVELLRLIAMCMIVGLHYFSYAGIDSKNPLVRTCFSIMF